MANGSPTGAENAGPLRHHITAGARRGDEAAPTCTLVLLTAKLNSSTRGGIVGYQQVTVTADRPMDRTGAGQGWFPETATGLLTLLLRPLHLPRAAGVITISQSFDIDDGHRKRGPLFANEVELLGGPASGATPRLGTSKPSDSSITFATAAAVAAAAAAAAAWYYEERVQLPPLQPPTPPVLQALSLSFCRPWFQSLQATSEEYELDERVNAKGVPVGEGESNADDNGHERDRLCWSLGSWT
ncbi:hypothetical protein CSOJ01_06234 [Colletotrichum sojae]|uniref:Uncharacterized protein n=1 Tax=Colletotrichum sojae TaxID=2175907 RepID=A0A8H6JDF4_9PEZI|nr:hypothetical protein CSOJ01_06234 [Colletotrichum sojae]